jgi:hypothetical protein
VKTNWEVLQSYDLDLHKALLQAQPFCSLTTGSEFRVTSVLEPLCHFHPLWPHMKQWLTEGARYPLHLISEIDHLTDLQVNYEHRNHQSAIYNEKHLTNKLMDEVSRGWQLILPRKLVLQLPQPSSLLWVSSSRTPSMNLARLYPSGN